MMEVYEKLTTQQPTNFTTVFATDRLNHNISNSTSSEDVNIYYFYDVSIRFIFFDTYHS